MKIFLLYYKFNWGFILSILLKIINIIKNIVILLLDYIYNSKNTLELTFYFIIVKKTKHKKNEKHITTKLIFIIFHNKCD